MERESIKVEEGLPVVPNNWLFYSLPRTQVSNQLQLGAHSAKQR